eukprot:298408_1
MEHCVLKSNKRFLSNTNDKKEKPEKKPKTKKTVLLIYGFFRQSKRDVTPTQGIINATDGFYSNKLSWSANDGIKCGYWINDIFNYGWNCKVIQTKQNPERTIVTWGINLADRKETQGNKQLIIDFKANQWRGKCPVIGFVCNPITKQNGRNNLDIEFLFSEQINNVQSENFIGKQSLMCNVYTPFMYSEYDKFRLVIDLKVFDITLQQNGSHIMDWNVKGQKLLKFAVLFAAIGNINASVEIVAYQFVSEIEISSNLLNNWNLQAYKQILYNRGHGTLPRLFALNFQQLLNLGMSFRESRTFLAGIKKYMDNLKRCHR